MALSGVPDFSEFLNSSPSESRPAQLELARRQADARSPHDLVTQWSRDRSVRPAEVDQRDLLKLDALALQAAAGYEALQLSPVAPLGTNSVVAPTSQDRTLSTTRGTEVVSDPTNVLALEAAARLAAEPSAEVRLCTVHQTLRMQPVGSAPGTSPHFRLFALADAGRALPDDGFEVGAVIRQLSAFDRLFDACESEGRELAGRRAIVRVSTTRSVLGDRVEEALRATLGHVAVVREELDSTYYDGLRVGFGAHGRTGAFHEIADLGAFDWVARLTSNARHRYVAGGLGVQLVPLLF